MKLSISNIAWLPEENDDIIEVLNRLCIAGVEVAPTLLFEHPADRTDVEIEEVRQSWNNNGIQIIALQSLLFGRPELTLFDRSEIRDHTLQYLKQIVKLGSKLGASSLVFGSPRVRNIGNLSRNRAIDIAVNFFGELADTALGNHTCLCMEPNAREYGCDFVTTLSEAVDIVRHIDHPGFRIIVDTGNMMLNGETVDELDEAFPYLQHFHISEPFLKKISTSRFDHKRIGDYLKQNDYQGWISIEMRNDLGASNVSVVDECLNYAVENYLQ